MKSTFVTTLLLGLLTCFSAQSQPWAYGASLTYESNLSPFELDEEKVQLDDGTVITGYWVGDVFYSEDGLHQYQFYHDGFFIYGPTKHAVWYPLPGTYSDFAPDSEELVVTYTDQFHTFYRYGDYDGWPSYDVFDDSTFYGTIDFRPDIQPVALITKKVPSIWELTHGHDLEQPERYPDRKILGLWGTQKAAAHDLFWIGVGTNAIGSACWGWAAYQIQTEGNTEGAFGPYELTRGIGTAFITTGIASYSFGYSQRWERYKRPVLRGIGEAILLGLFDSLIAQGTYHLRK